MNSVAMRLLTGSSAGFAASGPMTLLMETLHAFYCPVTSRTRFRPGKLPRTRPKQPVSLMISLKIKRKPRRWPPILGTR